MNREIPHLPAQLVSQIVDISMSAPWRTVHYTGFADEALLRALLSHRDRLEVSVMDMENRWGSATRLFWDEFESSGMAYPECPEWLESVTFYEEGASDHDISLRDCPWDSATQFDDIVAFTGRQPPRLVLLFGRADLATWHPKYEWTNTEGLRTGRWHEPEA